jgi:hypothetical protein
VRFALYTRIEAAVAGQTKMSALTGRPGDSRRPVSAPINQNGREHANSNTKNVDTDLLGGVAAFKASSNHL